MTLSREDLVKGLTEGKTQSQIGREHGVAAGTVTAHKTKAGLTVENVRRNVVSRYADFMAGQNLSAMEQLGKINVYAHWLLDSLVTWLSTDNPDPLKVLPVDLQKKKVKVGGEVVEITKFKGKDPRSLAIQLMQELRQQMELQQSLIETYSSLETVKLFMELVIAELQNESPDLIVRVCQSLEAKGLDLGFSQESGIKYRPDEKA